MSKDRAGDRCLYLTVYAYEFIERDGAFPCSSQERRLAKLQNARFYVYPVDAYFLKAIGSIKDKTYEAVNTKCSGWLIAPDH